MLAKPNPKHMASLLAFFERGCTQRGTGGFGVEIEHLPVHNADDTAVTYFEERGVQALLERLRPYYDAAKEVRTDDGQLVGLGRDRVSVTLEPGGQLETSIGVLNEPAELTPLYREFREELDPIAEELGFRMVNYGYQPVSRALDIPVNPKPRYAAMTEYLGRVGQFGPAMMRASSSTQVSLDYVDERDSIIKMRLATAVAPILSWMFRNSPYFEGAENPWPLMRQRMWDYLDFQRTNVSPGLYDPRFDWETYANDVLCTPLMFADLTHTPEADGELEYAAFHQNAGDVYPDRELNDYEINHILSTHFNDVRLKNFIEIRHWDSLPVERAERLTQIVGGMFYDEARRERLVALLDGLREEDVFEAKATLQARGGNARPYDRSLDEWADLLGVTEAGGTLAAVPGDAKYPDVFQK
ncbi:putative glutamate--cysteine ligase [Bifidobacterium gallicum DSM 20093 = LMG 11596]|nr:putative glutamate--cysteine ligase [Bifidobacterium gallicum DSM 20093 = LMG 11596]